MDSVQPKIETVSPNESQSHSRPSSIIGGQETEALRERVADQTEQIEV
jgi:hypothetical protein